LDLDFVVQPRPGASSDILFPYVIPSEEDRPRTHDLRSRGTFLCAREHKRSDYATFKRAPKSWKAAEEQMPLGGEIEEPF
jgi:hypothetical protein